jgi:hypothetical protein
MTQVGAGTGLVPRLRRSDHLRDWFPALPGWAEVLTTGPPGLASIAIFAVSFLSQLATGKPVAPTAHRARRDDKSSSGLIPRGWAEVLTTGPPGPASIAIFAVSFLSQLATGKPTTPTARRAGGMTNSRRRPTLALWRGMERTEQQGHHTCSDGTLTLSI